eukprot:TRINITY_DN3210_c1_g1_i1.p7 TRINITY_DN3210_c1_g1~~TRINITY_DN3210_c1_g1_i1.p7  ORF type:complete len:101 (+),score=0.02 TRINITY_DN3210_c1_g1_i1:329-631(+)
MWQAFCAKVLLYVSIFFVFLKLDSQYGLNILMRHLGLVIILENKFCQNLIVRKCALGVFTTYQNLEQVPYILGFSFKIKNENLLNIIQISLFALLEQQKY